MENTTEEIVIRIQKGELELFGGIYDQFIKKIYDFVYYRTFHKETAEDLTSHIFTKALENIQSYKSTKGSFSTWLYQIARNTVIDHYRTKKEHMDIEFANDLHSPQNVETEAGARIHLDKVKAYLKNLNPEHRDIVLMRVWDGLSYKEIAEITGKSEASTKMAFGRILEKMQKEIPFAILLLMLFKP